MRTLGVIDIVAWIVLLALAITKRGTATVVIVMLIYAFCIFLPGAVLFFVKEVYGPSKKLRMAIMLAAWYSFSASIFINLFILGYIILYINCNQGGDD